LGAEPPIAFSRYAALRGGDTPLLAAGLFIYEMQPFVIPALHARKNSQLLIRGASTSRLLQHIQAGNSVSVGITIVDGIVLAKTVFNQSINDRAVVLFGEGGLIKNPDEKLKALEQFTNGILPGMEQRTQT
jgi:nitroimidazol reductase NimA-like FMN-containing flavoprotein (pyridoxamine 5'-phosphate oxidase superfamily)